MKLKQSQIAFIINLFKSLLVWLVWSIGIVGGIHMWRPFFITFFDHNQSIFSALWLSSNPNYPFFSALLLSSNKWYDKICPLKKSIILADTSTLSLMGKKIFTSIFKKTALELLMQWSVLFVLSYKELDKDHLN